MFVDIKRWNVFYDEMHVGTFAVTEIQSSNSVDKVPERFC